MNEWVMHDNHPTVEVRAEPPPERRHYDRRQMVRWPQVDMRRAHVDRRSGEFDTYHARDVLGDEAARETENGLVTVTGLSDNDIDERSI